MWGLIVLSALVIALLLSPPLVQLIGRTVSFLDFSGITSVELIQITQQAVLLAIGAGIVTASSGLFLAWRITTKNINDLKQVSRRNDKTWWQRSYLDLLAVGLAVYVLYTLLQQGGISASVDSPFADPLTFIGPTLFSLGLILLFLRFLPIFLGILARLIGITGNVPMLMALRELNRSMSRYRGSLLMTAFTLSLAGFTASMASTLDQSLLDVVRYRVGTELAVITVADPQTESTQDATTGQITEEVTGFNAPPVLDILQLPEIDDASRIGRYESRMTLSGQRLSGLVLGVDRAGLAGVSLTREDFSSIPLSRMLNDLATNRTGVILSHKTAEEYNVQIGQEVRYQVNVLGEWQAEIRATVVGFMDYFPTIDPQTMDYFLITSLDPIFEVAGTPLPFDVWLHVKAGVSLDQAEKAIRDVGFPVLRFADPHTLLLEAQAEPGRRGVLGFLSVGFLAAVSLTLIGTVIQGTASFQAQSSQLGSLRAMGMSSLSVRIYVLLLQGLIAISGVGSGTLIGLATTLLFLPLFDFSGGLPPYQLRIAWGDIQIVYSVFGTILILLALMMAFVLTRQQLAKAVKLGNI
jgi:putative ABC transport system permease protein